MYLVTKLLRYEHAGLDRTPCACLLMWKFLDINSFSDKERFMVNQIYLTDLDTGVECLTAALVFQELVHRGEIANIFEFEDYFYFPVYSVRAWQLRGLVNPKAECIDYNDFVDMYKPNPSLDFNMRNLARNMSYTSPDIDDYINLDYDFITGFGYGYSMPFICEADDDVAVVRSNLLDLLLLRRDYLILESGKIFVTRCDKFLNYMIFAYSFDKKLLLELI